MGAGEWLEKFTGRSILQRRGGTWWVTCIGAIHCVSFAEEVNGSWYIICAVPRTAKYALFPI